MNRSDQTAIVPVKAAVRPIGGIPRLVINGETPPGNLVFLNGDTLTKSAAIYQSEIGYISSEGLHLYSTIMNLSFTEDEETNRQAAERLDALLENDAEAQILLRVKTSQGRDPGVAEEELFTYADGRTMSFVSIASDRWFAQAKARTAALVRYIRAHERYAGHVFGYHLEWNEWMQPDFVTSPDVSKANSRKFRSWLAEKYGGDAALQAAWGTADTLDGACVPADLPIGVNEKAVMLEARDQRYLDYLDYIGELTASRIEDLARIIKEETAGESVVLSFYGYYFEIYHATSGHFALRRLLNCPYLDGFAGPTSYMDRHAGADPVLATSGYMTVVDSIARAGKLWVMESDERTFINRTDGPNDQYYTPLKSLEDIATVHRREVGIAMTHGAVLYPMDLSGLGWYDDASIWRNFARLNRTCGAYKDAQKSGSRYDVALVVDEKAQSAVGCSMLSGRMLAQMMLAIYRAGVRFALTEIGDVLDGRVDDCRLYLFVNPFRLSSETVDVLCERLHRDGKTAAFLYGFGRTAAADVKRLTGMDIDLEDVVADHVVAMDASVVPGMRDERPLNANGVSQIVGGETAVFGRYADGTAAAAVKEENGWRTVFCGAAGLQAGNIRALAAYSGVPVFCDSEDVLVADERLIVWNTSTPGDKTLRFAGPTDVYDYFEDRWVTGVEQITYPAMEAGVCKWLFYGEKKAVEALRLPRWEVTEPC